MDIRGIEASTASRVEQRLMPPLRTMASRWRRLARGLHRLAPRWRRLAPRLRPLVAIAATILVALIAIGVALQVTPAQTVTVAGQVIKVGATPRLSLDGPGEVDLFGQRLPTAVSFPGPIRPSLELSQIRLNSQLATYVQGTTASKATKLLRARVAEGFERYVLWEDAAAAGIVLLLAGALAGWRRLPAGAATRMLAVTLVTTQAINLGAVALSVYGAQRTLRSVHSLTELVGAVPVAPGPVRPEGPVVTGVQEVVVGDSTAAGAGLPSAPRASAADHACGRSPDAYAQALANLNKWRVVNLACDSASVQNGLLSPQELGSRVVPAQLDAAARIRNPAVVIVSVGADDLSWAAIVQYCAASSNCDNLAKAYFQQALAAFSTDYLQLLIRLGSLPGRPQVVINNYYNPFGPNLSCVAPQGLTAAKVHTLTTWLDDLNKVLAAGARQFGFASAQPSFAGHQLCAAESYVQGLAGKAPFHPTALGQLAIALADEQALTQASSGPSTGASPSSPRSP
ncbi:MAG: SGNH/GDSL hydrolase family protein [Actinobacteria bacterium]|nr:SGNH/GDSL hydrolase family protein [Actinomycetota bacterium]MBO0835872.1 SGNH/GDSL hydrolase family protein [Actinomycetota bacterium]